MRDTLQIRGLGRHIRGVPSPDRPVGLFVKEKGLQGWEGLPTGRREALARAVAHGEHDVPVRLPARVITIDGWAIAHSLTELRKLSQSVTGWGATGDRFSLTVEHQEQVLTATVRRMLAEADDTGVRFAQFYRAEFQVQLLAADPRRYGETARFPGEGNVTAMTVFHRGNFPAHPVIEIPSAPAAYSVSSPAGTFTVTGATAGGIHRIDMRTGRVTRDGVWMPNVGRGRVWAVPDNAQWAHTLSAPGAVLITDTYV